MVQSLNSSFQSWIEQLLCSMLYRDSAYIFWSLLKVGRSGWGSDLWSVCLSIYAFFLGTLQKRLLEKFSMIFSLNISSLFMTDMCQFGGYNFMSNISTLFMTDMRSFGLVGIIFLSNISSFIYDRYVTVW